MMLMGNWTGHTVKVDTNTIVHTSTTPTSSDTSYNVLSSPNTATVSRMKEGFVM